jgi:hypothetical protein
MTADLQRLDAELESISVDQVAVGRGMLAAREWAGQRLTEVDAALDSLASGVEVAAAPAARNVDAGPAKSDLDDLFDETSFEAGGESLSAPSAYASSGDISSDLAAVLEGDDDDDDFGAALGASSGAGDLGEDDDELVEYDDLEILTDDDDLLITD